MINTSSPYLEYRNTTVLHFPIKNGMHLFVFNNILFYYYAIFIICSMSQYLNGLSYGMTQLYGSSQAYSYNFSFATSYMY